MSASAGPNPLELSKSEIQNQCNCELNWMQKNDPSGIGPATSQLTEDVETLPFDNAVESCTLEDLGIGGLGSSGSFGGSNNNGGSAGNTGNIFGGTGGTGNTGNIFGNSGSAISGNSGLNVFGNSGNSSKDAGFPARLWGPGA